MPPVAGAAHVTVIVRPLAVAARFRGGPGMVWSAARKP